TNLIATASSTSQVTVTWDAVTPAVSYRLQRSSNNSGYTTVATPTGTTFNDTGRDANTTYLYRVGAVDSANHVSSPSQPDLATTIVFTDEPLAAGTIVKALHFTELRTAIDAVRAAIGSGPATYTNAITMGGVIKAIDVTEMRSFLDSARSALFVPGVQYTDPSLNAGTTIIRAAHL